MVRESIAGNVLLFCFKKEMESASESTTLFAGFCRCWEYNKRFVSMYSNFILRFFRCHSFELSCIPLTLAFAHNLVCNCAPFQSAFFFVSALPFWVQAMPATIPASNQTGPYLGPKTNSRATRGANTPRTTAKNTN